MAESNKAIPSMFVPDAEVSLIKGTFFENDLALRTLRNLFLGLEVTAEEKKLIGTFSEELKQVIRKRFFPVISKEIPPGQLVDLWTGIDLVGKSKDEVYQTIEVRRRMIEMTKTALALMDNPDGACVKVDYDPRNDDLGITLTSRNRFIGHIEFQSRMLEVVANQKNETPEETKGRMTKNSSK